MTQGTQTRCSVTTYRGGMRWEVGGRFRREGIYVYLWLIYVDVWKKPTQYWKVFILRLKVIFLKEYFSKVFILFSSVTQSCLTLCDPMDCITPRFPVYHQLSELAQMHVHRVGDAIQPSHPLSAPSPSAFNLSQHQGLFQWVSSLHQVAKVFIMLENPKQ